jgi:ABC-type branched-subunit amino acid transport system ATPase component
MRVTSSRNGGGSVLSTLLSVEAVCAGYGQIPVLRDVSISVEPGQVVALLGLNGAGKTTTLRAVSGVIPAQSGTVKWKGMPTSAPLHRRARAGLAYVSEERSIFRQLSTRDNMRAAGVTSVGALELFPELSSRLHVKAGLLSGGEQQMLALSLALGRSPELLLIDELSLGLAPQVVERLLRTVRNAADAGLGVLVVEQSIRRVLDIADAAYVLQRGEVVLSGSAATLRGRVSEIEASYFEARSN